MRRSIGVGAIVLGMWGMLSALPVAAAAPQPLRIYNLSRHIPPTVYREFERTRHVRIDYTLAVPREEVDMHLRPPDTDLLIAPAELAYAWANREALQPIPFQAVPNTRYIDDRIGSDRIPAALSPYAVPFVMASGIIAVSTGPAYDYPRNYHIFSRRDFKGKMSLLADQREVLAAALKAQGFSANSVDPEELRQARDLVLLWTPQIVWDSTRYGIEFAAGHRWAVQGHVDRLFRSMGGYPSALYEIIVPQQSSYWCVDYLLVPSGADFTRAVDFINYLHQPEIYAVLMDYLGEPSLNTAARGKRHRPPAYTEDELFSGEMLHPLGAGWYLWRKMWMDILDGTPPPERSGRGDGKGR